MRHLWSRRRRSDPLPPENARVVYTDGRVVPLECIYLGSDDQGIHVWGAVAPVALENGMHLTCDRLPPRTGIVVAAQREIEP